MLSVTVVQEASALDPAANRARLHELVPSDSDLVVLPEAFARDFGEAGSDVSAFAESLDGAFATELAAVAAERNTTVVAGMFEISEDPGRPYNTLLVRGAADASYRKIHLYDSFGYKESDSLHAGPLTPVVVDVAGFRIGLMTCYDLRFPELGRLLVDRGADPTEPARASSGAEVLVVPAAWVAGRRKVEHWRTLARARAIENTVFVVAAGQPGPRYTGCSLVVDPLGDVLAEAGDGPEVLRATLDRSVLEEARGTNPSLANRRIPATAL